MNAIRAGKFALITLRDMQQGQRLDYAYHVKMKKNRESADLIKELPIRIPSVQGIGLMLQETTVDSQLDKAQVAKQLDDIRDRKVLVYAGHQDEHLGKVGVGIYRDQTRSQTRLV